MMAQLDPAEYVPNRSIPAKIIRRVTQWQSVKPMPITPHTGIVSFTFDDFPKSAAEHGADAMDTIGASATYYTCTGMAGHQNIMGEIFEADDLRPLLEAGHEIGTHTETHLDCSRVDAKTIEQELEANTKHLTDILGKPPQSHFAWPYGETHISGKNAARAKVNTARGILPGTNRKGSDLMQLRSYELTPDDWTTKRAADAIEDAANNGGWVTIFTHDVRRNPSPFGTTPEALNRLAKLSRDSGVQVLNMSEAYAQMIREAGL